MTGTPWVATAALAGFGLVVGCLANAFTRHAAARRMDRTAPYCAGYRLITDRGEHLLDASHACPSCGQPLDARSPALVLGTGLVFAALTLRFGLTVQLPAYLYLAAVGLTLASVDLRTRQLPDAILLPSYLVGLLLLMPAGAEAADWWPAARAATGTVAFFAIYFALMIGYPTAMHLGDAKLAGLIGLYLGWLSWAALLVGACAALLVPGVGNFVVRRGHGTLSRGLGFTVAYGSSMVAAAGLAVFGTAPLATWYGSIVGAS